MIKLEWIKLGLTTSNDEFKGELEFSCDEISKGLFAQSMFPSDWQERYRRRTLVVVDEGDWPEVSEETWQEVCRLLELEEPT